MSDDIRIRAAEAIEREHGEEQCIGVVWDDGSWNSNGCGCHRCWDESRDDVDSRWLAVAAGLRDNARRHQMRESTGPCDVCDSTRHAWCAGCDDTWPCPDAAAQIAIAQAWDRGAS